MCLPFSDGSFNLLHRGSLFLKSIVPFSFYVSAFHLILFLFIFHPSCPLLPFFPLPLPPTHSTLSCKVSVYANCMLVQLCWESFKRSPYQMCIRYINHVIYLISQPSQRSHTMPGMPRLLTSWKTVACQGFPLISPKKEPTEYSWKKTLIGFFFFFRSERKT